MLLQERQAQLRLSAARETSELQKSQMIWVQGLNKLFEMAPVLLRCLTKGESDKAPEELLKGNGGEHQTYVEQEKQLFGNVPETTIAAWKTSLTPEQFSHLMKRLDEYRARHGSRSSDESTAPPAVPFEAASADRALAPSAAKLYQALAHIPRSRNAAAGSKGHGLDGRLGTVEVMRKRKA